MVNGVSNVFRYSFLEGTPLVSGMTNTLGFGWSRSYETNRNLIVAVSNRWDSSSVSVFDYENDTVGRRKRRIDAAQSLSFTNVFAYNQRSEVTNAVMGTSTFGYDYDDIGNRLMSSVNSASSSYTANTLNQYTAITGASACTPTYDLDGNMTWDGRFIHTWDGENRLIKSMPGGSGATNGAVLVENSYDYQNRRFKKTVKQLSGRGAGYPMDPSQSGSWNTIETRYYVWDKWNIAAEIIVNDTAVSTNINYYTWGLDLSGSLQGAGGVRGLLAVTKASSSATNAYFACADANGNVTEYSDTCGSAVARYGYSAFGETTAKSGPMADDFTHQFSTKPFDGETGYSKFQLRDYSPSLARWANRDPIEEGGGKALYVILGNNSINHADYLGLAQTVTIVTDKTTPDDVDFWKKALGEKNYYMVTGVGSLSDFIRELSESYLRTGDKIERINLSGHGIFGGVGAQTRGPEWVNLSSLTEFQKAELRRLLTPNAVLFVYSCYSATGENYGLAQGAANDLGICIHGKDNKCYGGQDDRRYVDGSSYERLRNPIIGFFSRDSSYPHFPRGVTTARRRIA